jgi:hypothetical protein
MKLYEVPRKTYIIFEGEVIYFDHIDGAYSYCKDLKGNIIHLSASTEVSILPDKLEAVESKSRMKRLAIQKGVDAS